jgi:hypothetical protein
LINFPNMPSNAMTLQAARRIAQEESFGSSSLVRGPNMAQIPNRAKLEAAAVLAAKEVTAAELSHPSPVKIATLDLHDHGDRIPRTDKFLTWPTVAVAHDRTL